MPERVVTIERFILTQQSKHPEATGVLTSILYNLALAGKMISRKANRAGLADILGKTGDVNVQGEQVAKLDEYANQAIVTHNMYTGRLAAMASEEREDIIPIPEKYSSGKYVLLFDPLDGSSNIDYSVSVGTIFAIYRRKSQHTGPGDLNDCLQRGRDIVAAGYMLYGSNTMLVYSAGQGVHGFTLDSSLGEFLLTHPNIKIPPNKGFYSVNHGYQKYWSAGVKKYTEYLQGFAPEFAGLSLRYIGSLVCDVHRTLLAGGVFYYPVSSKDPSKPHGKLRLIYEAAPLAFLAAKAGGYASDGYRDILDIKPERLHQRTPLFIGDKKLVEKAEELIAHYD